jgi:two-component system NtrC family sensor kinase
MVKRGRKTAKRATAPGRVTAIPKSKSSTLKSAKTKSAGPQAGKPKSAKSKSAKSRPGNSKSAMPRLQSELRAARDRQTATSEILRIISQSPTDTQPVFEAIVLTAVRLLRCDMSFVMLCDPAAFWVAAAATPEGLFDDLTLIKQPIDPSANFPSRVIVEKRALYLPDWSLIDLPEHERHIHETIGVNSALYLPLLREGECIGLLTLGGKQANLFGESDIALAESFRDQALIAIENTRLFNEVQAKTRDLSEALTYQTGSSNILKVIASSPTDVRPVLTAIVENACELCEAYDAALVLKDGNDLRFSAHHGPIPIGLEKWPINRNWTAGRAFVDQTPVHVHDLLNSTDFPEGRELARRMGHRTILSVPLLRDHESIGALALRRTEVNPFSDKQITLLQTFADQAVIALGNVRLFDEVQAKTRDLSEALQQQTATADVLKVISRSAFDLQTVLDTLVVSAARLCDADRACIFQKQGEVYRWVSNFGFSPELIAYADAHPFIAGTHSTTSRVALEGKPVHNPDVLADPNYRASEYQRLGNYRTILGIPLLREGAPIGVFILTREQVRPFADRQIELVTSFADQAVIAIENVRLFDEVQARTRELAASLDDLRTAQDRLIQTEKLASLGQLTAGIAHEIKNPLNFVNNFSALSAELTDELNDLLRPAPLDDKMRQEVGELTRLIKDNLEKVVQHGKRADSIVKNMLLHSREGSGEQRPTDINALLDESLNLAYHGARAEKPGFNITLQRDFDEAAGTVEGFPQEITRAFLNLISNGFYAATKRWADNGEADFEPQLSATTRDLGGHVEIRIRDNGTGIPPAVKEKMFNPFFTTKPAGEGTGLGLSMSHDIIVKQHGGRIDVATEPGQFTEFTILLPRTIRR